MDEILHASDSRIAAYHSLREFSQRADEGGLIVIEGPDALGVLLKSSLTIKNIFLEPSYFELFSAVFENRPELLRKCFVAHRPLMSEIVGYRLHRGVLALAERPTPTAVADLEFPIVAFNGLVDAENVGSIVRSAQAFGISSFLVDRLSADPFLRRAIRVSMGAVLASKVAYVDSLEKALSLFDNSVSVVAVEQTADAIPLSEVRFSKKSVFIFGKEKGGISEALFPLSAMRVSIPMTTSIVSSLNVAGAAAIVLSRFAERS